MAKGKVFAGQEGNQSASEQGEYTKQSFTETNQPRINKNLRENMISKLKKNPPRIQLAKKELQKKFEQFITSKHQTIEQEVSASTCQFICPICLEMYMTPCPTSCGHIFCYRCIDETIVRNSSCPTCRNFIRNEQFIESKPFAGLCEYFWLTSKQKALYLQKHRINEKWLKKRRIEPKMLKINDAIDVRDTEHIWCKAKIIDIFVNEKKTQLLIHFEGWNDIYNEVININSQRLAPLGFFSDREDIPTYRLSSPDDNIRSRIDYRNPREEEPRENNMPGRQITFSIGEGTNLIRLEWRPAQRRERRSLEQFVNIRPNNLRRQVVQEQSDSSDSSDSQDSGSMSESESQLDEGEGIEQEQSQIDEQFQNSQSYQEQQTPRQSQASQDILLGLSESSEHPSRNVQHINLESDSALHGQQQNYIRELLSRPNAHTQSDSSLFLIQPNYPEEQEEQIPSQNRNEEMGEEINEENNNGEGDQQESQKNEMLIMLSPDHNPSFKESEKGSGEMEKKKELDLIESKNNPEQAVGAYQIEAQNPVISMVNTSTKLN